MIFNIHWQEGTDEKVHGFDFIDAFYRSNHHAYELADIVSYERVK